MNKFLIVYEELLSPEECQVFIKHFDSCESEHVDRGIAEYFRLEEDLDTVAKMLWNRIKNVLPEEYNGNKIINLNDHFRYSKYDPGMEFKMHRDGINQDKYGNRSQLTVNIFLNDDFDGGETAFYDDSKNLVFTAKPCPGKAVIFDRNIFHTGNKVLNGQKYILRTDVMST